MTTPTTPETTRQREHLEAIQNLTDACHTAITDQQDDWEEIAKAHLDGIRDRAEAMAAERDQWEQAATSHMRHIREMAKERDAAQDRADEMEARIDRLQKLVAAEIAFSTMLVDTVDEEYLNSRRYPTWLDNESSRLAAICHKHGDLSSNDDRSN